MTAQPPRRTNMALENTMIGTTPLSKPTRAIIYEDHAVMCLNYEDARRRAKAEALTGRRCYVTLLIAEFIPTVEERELPVPPPPTAPNAAGGAS